MSIESVLKGNSSWHVEVCDVLHGLRAMPPKSVHCVVTSPPYWGLRDYGVEGQIGLEKTPQEFIAKMVEVFEEVRRVLRDDGTAWVNFGDGYSRNPSKGGSGPGKNKDYGDAYGKSKSIGAKQLRLALSMQKKLDWQSRLKEKDLIGMPWRVAFALQDAGWYLRSEIIWSKRSPMPESVRDRPTRAHEQIFLLTKSPRYFYDPIASAEPCADSTFDRQQYGRNKQWGHVIEANKGIDPRSHDDAKSYTAEDYDPQSGRNMRTVWTLSTEAFPGAHFATFPTELVRRCLLAGTSEKGCCIQCGSPWKRIIERERRATRPGTSWKGAHPESPLNLQTSGYLNVDPQRHIAINKTTGWQPTCKCDKSETLNQPCIVLDPFSGAGTTAMVARKMGCRAIGLELNPEYAAMSRQRINDDMPLLNAV